MDFFVGSAHSVKQHFTQLEEMPSGCVNLSNVTSNLSEGTRNLSQSHERSKELDELHLFGITEGNYGFS